MESHAVFDAQVVLLPEGAVQRKLIALSYSLARRFSTFFTLDKKRFLPHLTLYQSAFPIANKTRVYEGLQSCIVSTPALTIALHNFSEWRGALFYDAEKDDTLVSLHQRIVTSLNPLREGLLTEECRNFLHDPSSNSQERRNIVRYGNPLVLKQYRPHVTLTKLMDVHEKEKALAYLNCRQRNLSFTADALYLTLSGEHYTCNRILARFPFYG